MERSYKATVEKLTKTYPTLSKQLKKSAEYVLEHPADVATLSMRQVAARADVPPPTMNRLAKSLEFETYNAFRDVFREGIEDIAPSYPQKAGRLQATLSTSNIDVSLQSFKGAALGNLQLLFDSMDRVQIQRVAQQLSEARNVIVVGMHASHSLANYFHYVAAMCFPNWRLVTRHNGGISDRIEDIGPKDVVVAIALAPCAADTVRIAKQASDVGANVVGITDRRTSPLAAYSSEVLLIPVKSPLFFESYIATTALIEVILGFLIADGGESIIEKIHRLEQCREELGEYWRDQ